MARKQARPIMKEPDHEYLDAYFEVPEVYTPEHTLEQIRRYEGIKEVLTVLRKQFSCPT